MQFIFFSFFLFYKILLRYVPNTDQNEINYIKIHRNNDYDMALRLYRQKILTISVCHFFFSLTPHPTLEVAQKERLLIFSTINENKNLPGHIK